MGLGKKNTTGLCNRCRLASYRNSPEFEAKRVAGWRDSLKDPVKLAERREIMRRAGASIPLEARIRNGRKAYVRYLDKPEVRAKNKEATTRSNKARAEARLFWCAPEYRDLYRNMVQRKNFRAAEAKQMILSAMERDRRNANKAAAKPAKSHEEQLALVEQGKASIAPALIRHHLEPRFGA